MKINYKLYLYINLKAVWAERRILDGSLPGLHSRGGKGAFASLKMGCPLKMGFPQGHAIYMVELNIRMPVIGQLKIDLKPWTFLHSVHATT